MAKSKSTTVRSKRTRSRGMTINQAQQLYLKVRKSPATMTNEEVYALENAIQGDPFGMTRRLAFATLSQSGKHILDSVKKDREFAVGSAAMMDNIGSYRKALQGLLDHVTAAEVRLMVAMAQRKDMHEIFAEAKRASAEVAHA